MDLEPPQYSPPLWVGQCSPEVIVKPRTRGVFLAVVLARAHKQGGESQVSETENISRAGKGIPRRARPESVTLSRLNLATVVEREGEGEEVPQLNSFTPLLCTTEPHS